MNFGCIVGESAEIYHSTPAVGCHKLADFNRSPLLYYRRYISKEAPIPAPTPALAFGQYLHSLALEGEEATNARYIVLPDDAPDRPTAKMREAKKNSPASQERIQWWDQFILSAAGKTITTNDDSKLAWRMVESIRSKATARKLFARGTPEVTFRKQMASFPVQIVDLKSIDELGDFPHHFHKFNYYYNAAFYQLVLNSTLALGDVYPRYLFVVSEKDEPFDVAFREPDDIALEIGRMEVMRDLGRLKTCYDENVWPAEPDEIRPVNLPDWKIVKSLV